MTAPIGVAILGCAHCSHAWSYARALSASPAARLVGVYDDNRRLADPVVSDFGAPYFADAAELVALPQVEAVVVCSSTVEHRGLVELAAANGCAVLCEKPIATTYEDAVAMVAACAAAGVPLQMAFVTRFHPLVAEVRTAIDAGELGDLLAIVGGNRGRPPLPPAYPPWITDAAQSGGGALMDHSVHLTDVMRHLSGSEVVRVSAEVGSRLWSCGVDDVALLSLVFDSGMVASVDPSWSVPADNPWDYDFFLRFLGTGGSLDIDDLGASLQLVSGRTTRGMRLVPFGVDVDVLMVEGFLESVRSGELVAPGANGDDGVRSLEIALAGYESAATAAPVTLPRG